MSDYHDENALLQLLVSDPTEHAGGPSETLNAMRCARHARLTREAAIVDGPAPDVMSTSTFKRDVGTLTHKLVELHHIGERPEDAVPLPDMLDNIPLQDRLRAAWLLFEKYRVEFPIGFWGICLGTEVKLNPGRVDALFELDGAAQARIMQRFDLAEPPPTGVMVWDLKTAWQKDNNLAAKHEWSLQGGMYLPRLVDSAVVPTSFAIFQAINYKTTKQDWTCFVWYPATQFLGEEGRARTEAAVKTAALNMSADRCNLAVCHMYGECEFKVNGQCLGY